MPLLMELADEFHLTTVEALEVCDRLGIEASDLMSEVSDTDARAFRSGVERGVLDGPGDDEAPEAPSLAKQMGVDAAPPPPPVPGTPAAASAPGPSLRDRLPDPVADNLLVIAVSAVVVIGLIGYAIVSMSSSSESPTDPEVLGLEAASSLTINDCVDLPEGASLDELPQLELLDSPACAEPHDIELYAEVRTYQGRIMERFEEYPGVDELVADSLSECIARYEKSIGAPYRDSTYEVVALVPTGDLWIDPPERVTMCGVAATDGSKLEGSVKTSTD